jgi:poly-gamma-glutamate synthase PgsB/CapB
MYLVFVLSLALLALGLCENVRHQRNLRRIPVRILVNGTRGKSGVTRLVAGALREAGFRTIAKTTGSEARIILGDGTEIPVKRPFGARITEQKALARLAVAHGAEALVVECMAVRAESQMVMQRQLVRATIGVITNVRVDHVEEMGATGRDTASALSFSIPEDGTLVTTDPRFAGTARRVVITDSSRVDDATLARFSWPVFAENVALALDVAAELGIDGETALRGMVAAKPDIGALGLFELVSPSFRAILVNGFAANDVVSTRLVWEKASNWLSGGSSGSSSGGKREPSAGSLPGDLPVFLLYNNRADREYRVAEFLGLPSSVRSLAGVAVSGDHARKVAASFSRRGIKSFALPGEIDCETLLGNLQVRAGGDYVLFGVGNIQGMGRKLVEHCRERGTPLEWRGEGRCFANR